jgi:hypothetical protein
MIGNVDLAEAVHGAILIDEDVARDADMAPAALFMSRATAVERTPRVRILLACERLLIAQSGRRQSPRIRHT